MNRFFSFLISAFATVIVLQALGVIYIVDETQQAVILRFGKPYGRLTQKPGIFVKAPFFVDEAVMFDKRWLSWDGDANEIPTKDKKFIWLDTVARWRIVNPLTFLRTVTDMRGAIGRLNDVIDGATRDQVANTNLINLVRVSSRAFVVTESSRESHEDEERWTVGREEVLNRILLQANENVAAFGIEIVDVRIKHINYVPEVRQKVYERMIAERQRIAEKFRSEGQGERQKIEGQIERELKTIISAAERDASRIRGDADAKTIEIYAKAYNRDPDFYSFIKTLESYRKTLGGKTRLLQTTDTDYFKYLKKSEK